MRLGHKDQARADLEKFQKGNASGESQTLYLAVIVAAELGDGTDKALESLEAALKKQPGDSALHYDAARAYAQASQAVAGKDQAKSRALSERAIHLLRTAIQIGYADYKHMQEDADLDPLRELPAFAEIMRAGHLDRSYAAVWTEIHRFEANPVVGLDPAAHLQRCRELVFAGLSHGRSLGRPDLRRGTADHRLGLAPPGDHGGDQGPVGGTSGSGSSRPPSHGQSEEIWSLLRHSADPRLRSFIVNWLNPLGADPKLIAAELDRLDSVRPGLQTPPIQLTAGLLMPRPEPGDLRSRRWRGQETSPQQGTWTPSFSTP